MIKKYLQVLLCCLSFPTMGVAQSVDIYEGTDICLSASRNQEANDALIIQCLEGASLNTLARMQEISSPLWGLGNYVLEHPHLKIHYDDRIAVHCQNSSLETQAFIIKFDLFKDYITKHPDLNFAQHVAPLLHQLSFADLLDIHWPTDDKRYTASTIVGNYAQKHPVLKRQYDQRMLDVLQDLSLDQWGELHAVSIHSLGRKIVRSSLRKQHDDLIATLLQNLTLTDLLRINDEKSPLWGLGQYIRGENPISRYVCEECHDLKQLYDKRLAVMLPTLSLKTWNKFSHYSMRDFHMGVLTNPALKGIYEESVLKLIPSLSFEQMEEFPQWAYWWFWDSYTNFKNF